MGLSYSVLLFTPPLVGRIGLAYLLIVVLKMFISLWCTSKEFVIWMTPVVPNPAVDSNTLLSLSTAVQIGIKPKLPPCGYAAYAYGEVGRILAIFTPIFVTQYYS